MRLNANDMADSNFIEPIKLRFKQLKDGNQSIYLDCYVNGIREYKFLNLYLRPDNNIKPAFLFCCFSGLRYSDVQKLTWGEITARPGQQRRCSPPHHNQESRHFKARHLPHCPSHLRNPHTDLRSRPLHRLQTPRPLQYPHNSDLRQNRRRKQAQGS